MTVRQFDELHKLEYKPVVDRLIETIERTLPDSIDDCGIGCIVNFNERFDNSLIISLYVQVYSDLFYYEEDKMIELIRQYADKYGRKNKKI